MTIPKKDACDMLAASMQKDFANAFWKGAKTYTPETIIRTSSIADEALKPIEYGLSYPYTELTKLTYGLRIPQLIGIGAGPGAGKTTIVQSIQEHLLFTHKEKIATFSLEETPAYSLRRLAGHMMRKPIHLPDCKYDVSKLQATLTSLEGKVFFYNQVDYNDSFNDIENTIRFLAITEGIKYFFIDPISALHAHLDSSETNTYLNHAMVRLSLIVKNLGVTVFYVSHLNNPIGSSKDHGEGAKVRAGQFSGSRAMWKFSTDLIGLQRNQLATDPDEKNTVEVVILKNRLSGETGSFKLKYNKATGTLEDIPVVF
jgi:twinkle protein